MLLVLSCAVAALALVVDQVSKQLALAFLETDSRIPLIGDLLGLQLAFNTGAAFSLGSQLTPLITLLGVAASVFLIGAAARVRHPVKAVAIGMILGGALGNLADRMIAPPGLGRGAVTDMLAYGELFIGNLADVAIAGGVVLYLIAVWRVSSGEARRRSPSSGPGAGSNGPASEDAGVRRR
ncbi:signal peptidase II [Leucobacter sp. wl10]|uniref:signal peptidase II n=1 Tax=Leucobacter sp. wl10 TaxID=2304677 RepID=UPI001F09816A|nr:signal peptidase II [Leucobacter sp. wl10]